MKEFLTVSGGRRGLAFCGLLSSVVSDNNVFV